MTIRIRLFAWMAQQANTTSFSLEMAEGSALSAVREAVSARFPGLNFPANTLFALNQQYAPASTLLRDGDEVAIIPPVSGG